MAKVFSYSEMEGGKVPRTESFPLVLTDILGELDTCPGIVGAMLFGSTARQEQTIQSDIDLFVLYYRQHQDEVMKCFEKMTHIGKNLFVPVEIVAMSMDLFDHSMDFIGPQFLNHLEMQSRKGGMMIKSNPVAIALEKAHRVSVRDDAFDYFRSRLRMMNKGRAMLDPDSDRLFPFLQNLTQLPMHVARTVVFHNESRLANDSNRDIAKEYHAILTRRSATKIYDAFISLTIVNDIYADSLRRQIAAGYDEQWYKKSIDKLIEAIPQYEDFLMSNAIFVETLYSQAV